MKISIFMACYNTAPFLAEAMDSVLSQSWTDFEFIIVDDGSNDGSFEILDQYAKRDLRIRLFRQTNQGCAKAWNFAIDVAATDWIFRFDSDDVMYPGRLEKQIEFIKSNPGVKVVSGAVDYIDEHSNQ